MTTTSPNTAPFTVVVGNDFTPASGYAFDQAARVARRVPGSDLHVVHVVDAKVTAEQAKQLATDLRLYLEDKVKALGGLEGQAVGIHVRAGQPAREIAQLAKDVSADLIVLGTHEGPHLKQLVLGSVAERLLVASPCPVFIAGPMPAARDDAHEPAILPPCPDCVQARVKSAGHDWWCARHSEHHARAHSYSFHRQLPFRTHDSSVSPTGVDMK
jgi:nucleotide-binding universal stress UspA family protein